ncbi:MAG: outer membrane protein assembly factor BamE [Gemmataceae bacterium]|nr:outer membrane protein assembly factor BamE [Gemmataceae bacterium]
MKKRRCLWIVVVLVLLLGAGYGVLWLTAGPRHRINKESFERIQEGMTEEEVESIIGVPAGDYTTGPVVVRLMLISFMSPQCKSWKSNVGQIVVDFDSRGLITWKRYMDVTPVEESLWDKLRRWLRIN